MDCVIDLLEDEYQPQKQEKWIVYRTLRTQNKEVCIGIDDANTYRIMVGLCSCQTTYNERNATKYWFETAIYLRDELNKYRVGKQYLWVISKVEE